MEDVDVVVIGAGSAGLSALRAWLHAADPQSLLSRAVARTITAQLAAK